MKNILNRAQRACRGASDAAMRHKIAAVASLTAMIGVIAPSIAGADVIESGFTTETTSLTTYLGYALTAALAVVTLGVGIHFLVRWIRNLGRAAA